MYDLLWYYLRSRYVAFIANSHWKWCKLNHQNYYFFLKKLTLISGLSFSISTCVPSTLFPRFSSKKKKLYNSFSRFHRLHPNPVEYTRRSGSGPMTKYFAFLSSIFGGLFTVMALWRYAPYPFETLSQRWRYSNFDPAFWHPIPKLTSNPDDRSNILVNARHRHSEAVRETLDLSLISGNILDRSTCTRDLNFRLCRLPPKFRCLRADGAKKKKNRFLFVKTFRSEKHYDLFLIDGEFFVLPSLTNIIINF